MMSEHIPATRTIVMTGATRGIGKVAALRLLRDAPGVHLVIVARSGGEVAAEQLAKQSGNPNVTSLTADLASIASIRAATTALRRDLAKETLPPLGGIVGNAGIQLARADEATVDGIEATFAVNVLANYLLVEELHDLLDASARIILTTSDTHFGDFSHNMGMIPGPRWDDPIRLATPATTPKAITPGAGRTAYSTSKLAVIYLVHALSRRLAPGTGVFSFNPGFVPGTGLVRSAGPVTRFTVARIMPALTLTPWARTAGVSGSQLALAVTGPAPGESGSYIDGSRVTASSAESYDRAREDALWVALARIVARREAPTAPERSRVRSSVTA